MDQLAISSIMCCCDHVLRREDGSVLRWVIEFEVLSKKGRSKRTWKKQAKDNSCLDQRSMFCLSFDINQTATGLR